MSKVVKITNENQLKAFLRILAEESIAQAKDDVQGEKKHQDKVARAIKRDIGSFMKEEEVPPGAQPKPEPTLDLDAPADTAPAEPAAPTATEPKASPQVQPTVIEPSLDAVTRAILDLRSGKSVKDSAIEAELEAYYDRLNDAERYSMIIFLRSLSEIVTGKTSGAQAQDPSAEPHNVSITRPEAAETPAAPAAPETELAPEPAAPAEPPAAPPEDQPVSQGPIQVGSPVSEAFRQQIRRLIIANR